LFSASEVACSTDIDVLCEYISALTCFIQILGEDTEVTLLELGVRLELVALELPKPTVWACTYETDNTKPKDTATKTRINFLE
jgi:hypothetical protein